MKTTKSILLMVLLSYIALFAVLCMPIREQTRQEIVHEYQKHKEAFEYVKEYFIENEIVQIRRDSGKITVQNANTIIPFEDINDELLIKFVHLLFDDLHYFLIENSSSWKENVIQLTFKKETNKTYYYKEIVYCEDNEPPISTAHFTDVKQIDNYWFYCEEDEDEDLF